VSGRPGNSLTYDNLNAGSYVDYVGSRPIRARVGDSYVFTVDAIADPLGILNVYAALIHADGSSNIIDVFSPFVSAAWQSLELRFTLRDDSPSYTVQEGDTVAIWIEIIAGSDKPSFNSPSLKQLVGGTLIEDGAIATEKLAADAVTVNELDVNEALVKSLVAEMMTSRTFRTAESGQRTQIDEDGIRTFNSNDDETAKLSAGSGGIVLEGNVQTTDGYIASTVGS